MCIYILLYCIYVWVLHIYIYIRACAFFFKYSMFPLCHCFPMICMCCFPMDFCQVLKDEASMKGAVAMDGLSLKDKTPWCHKQLEICPKKMLISVNRHTISGDLLFYLAMTNELCDLSTMGAMGSTLPDITYPSRLSRC